MTISILRNKLLFLGRRHLSTFGYTQSKAIVFEKFGQVGDVLRLHRYSIPPAYGNEILVRFLVAPINPADLNQIEGVYPSKPRMAIDELSTTVPSAVPGNEGVVQVVSVGADVTGFSPGDRAIIRRTGFGTWRTHAIAKDADLLKVPTEFRESVNDIAAATVAVNPCTAYRMLRDFASLESGDWVIQNGANSGVGRAAIQLARIWGLCSINIVRHRPDIEELKSSLMALGADVVLTDEELADRSVGEKIKALTGSRGIKLGLNCIGGRSTTEMIRHLCEGGHVVTYGAMSRQPLTLPSTAFIFKDLHAHGFWVSRWSDQNPLAKEKMVQDMYQKISAGEFAEAPVEKTVWKADTTVEELIDTIQWSGQGFTGKKQVFVFKD